MGGAASVVGALYGIAALGLKAHVVVLTPLCGKLEPTKKNIFLHSYLLLTPITFFWCMMQKICHPERL